MHTLAHINKGNNNDIIKNVLLSAIGDGLDVLFAILCI